MARSISLNIPEEIWDQIISKIHHDQHLQPLSLVCKSFLSITNRHKKTLKIFNPTAHFLPSLLRRFPNIKHISLSDFNGDPAPILLQIAEFDFCLETLEISKHKRLPMVGFERLPISVRGCVKSLKVCSIYSIGDLSLGMIANLFPNLEDLDVSPGRLDDLDQVLPADVIEVFPLNGLKRISLGWNHLLTDNGLISLAENCPNFEVILLQNCLYVTEIGVGFALQACQNLKSIGLQKMYVAMNDFTQPIACAKNLSSIDFLNTQVSDALLSAIMNANLPLKSFTLHNCTKRSFTYSGIKSFLETYDCLDYIAIVGEHLLSDESMLTLVKSLTKARTVKLNFCEKLSDSTLLTLIKRCPLLETVEMEHTNLGKQDFRVTNALNPHIRTLKLSKNQYLSNESLKNIALACPNLEILELSNSKVISSKGVGVIFRNCRHLKHLNIRGCLEVQNLDLGPNTHKLEVLEAFASGLDDDDALIDISEKCPNLMFLNLSGCVGITAEGVEKVINRCTKLKEIHLNYCLFRNSHIVPLMVFGRPSLRKVVLPRHIVVNKDEADLYLKHGCFVAAAD